MKDTYREYFEDVIETCISCGICDQVHNEVHFTPFMFGPLARIIIDSDAVNSFSDELIYPIRGCALCNECTASCPVDIDAKEFMSRARAVLNDRDADLPEQYRPMRTDLKRNVFSGLLDAQDNPVPDDLAPEAPAHTGGSLFFAGCTLSSYAPQLANATMQWLRDAGEADMMTPMCCGNPVRGIGLLDEYERFARGLDGRLHEKGVSRIVIACPNCFYTLRTAQRNGGLKDIELVCLPQLLADRGVRIDTAAAACAGATTFAVHDSCHDRFDGLFARGIRALFDAPAELVEMEHRGKNAVCCGSGGQVSFFDMNRTVMRRDRRMREFDATNAQCLVTGCISCSNSMVRHNADVVVRHYLELMFDMVIDWDAFVNIQRKMDAAGGYDFTMEPADRESVFDGDAEVS